MANHQGDLSLAARVDRFRMLLGCCEITGKNHAALEVEAGIEAALQILAQGRESGSNVYVVGNGGSASIAAHAVVDFLHVAGLRAFTLHDSSLLTCMANDYGYENAFARILAKVARPGDTLIAISSSGRSMNIRNAATQMVNSGGSVMTVSGFAHDNPLRSMGEINIWLDSSDYGLVEIGHQFILHNLADRLAVGCASALS